MIKTCQVNTKFGEIAKRGQTDVVEAVASFDRWINVDVAIDSVKDYVAYLCAKV